MRYFLLTFAIMSVAMAGCIGGPSTGTFGREIALLLDDETISSAGGADSPEDILNAVATVYFRYSHLGKAESVTGLTVKFASPNGRPAEVPMSSLTARTELVNGDSIRIGPTSMTSGVSIWRGQELVAQRQLDFVPWLEASGYPLPIAADAGGKATWKLDGSMAVTGNLQGLNMSGMQMETGMAALEATLAGTISMSASGRGENITLDTAMDMVSHGTALLQATVDDIDYGLDGSFDASADGNIALQFLAGQLQSMTTQGSATVDGHLYLWGENSTRAEKIEPSYVPHPFFANSFGPTTEPFPEIPVQETIAAFLAALWSMTFEPGDFVTVIYEVADGSTLEYDMRVAGKENRNVGGTTFSALRIEGRVEFSSQSFSLDAIRFTNWVDSESYLPIEIKQETTYNFTAQDLRSWAAFLGDSGGPMDGNLSVTVTTETTIQDYQEGLRVAAVLGPGAPIFLPLATSTLFSAAMPFASETEASMWEAPPQISFQSEVDADGAGFTATVVHVEVADWEEFYDVNFNGCVFPPSRAVQAGDTIDCTMLETGMDFQLLHWPSDAIVLQIFA